TGGFGTATRERPEMHLLISVAGPAEARAALRGGADVIDAKDPRRGALGPVPLHRLAAIRAAVAGARPLSAALGDAASEQGLAGAVAAVVAIGVAFVKIGFAGVTSEARARRLAVAAQRRVGADGGGAPMSWACGAPRASGDGWAGYRAPESRRCAPQPARRPPRPPLVCSPGGGSSRSATSSCPRSSAVTMRCSTPCGSVRKKYPSTSFLGPACAG